MVGKSPIEFHGLPSQFSSGIAQLAFEYRSYLNQEGYNEQDRNWAFTDFKTEDKTNALGWKKVDMLSMLSLIVLRFQSQSNKDQLVLPKPPLDRSSYPLLVVLWKWLHSWIMGGIFAMLFTPPQFQDIRKKYVQVYISIGDNIEKLLHDKRFQSWL